MPRYFASAAALFILAACSAPPQDTYETLLDHQLPRSLAALAESEGHREAIRAFLLKRCKDEARGLPSRFEAAKLYSILLSDPSFLTSWVEEATQSLLLPLESFAAAHVSTPREFILHTKEEICTYGTHPYSRKERFEVDVFVSVVVVGTEHDRELALLKLREAFEWPADRIVVSWMPRR